MDELMTLLEMISGNYKELVNHENMAERRREAMDSCIKDLKSKYKIDLYDIANKFERK